MSGFDEQRRRAIAERRRADEQREITVRSAIGAHQMRNPRLNDRDSEDWKGVKGEFDRLVATGFDADDLRTELAAVELASRRRGVKSLGQPRPEPYQGGHSGWDDEQEAPEPELSRDQSDFLAKLAARGTISPETAASTARRMAARNK